MLLQYDARMGLCCGSSNLSRRPCVPYEESMLGVCGAGGGANAQPSFVVDGGGGEDLTPPRDPAPCLSRVLWRECKYGRQNGYPCIRGFLPRQPYEWYLPHLSSPFKSSSYPTSSIPCSRSGTNSFPFLPSVPLPSCSHSYYIIHLIVILDLQVT